MENFQWKERNQDHITRLWVVTPWHFKRCAKRGELSRENGQSEQSWHLEARQKNVKTADYTAEGDGYSIKERIVISLEAPLIIQVTHLLWILLINSHEYPYLVISGGTPNFPSSAGNIELCCLNRWVWTALAPNGKRLGVRETGGHIWKAWFGKQQQQQESDWCLQERSALHLPGVVTTTHTLKPGSSSTTKLGPGRDKKGRGPASFIGWAATAIDFYLFCLCLEWIPVIGMLIIILSIQRSIIGQEACWQL